MKLYLSSQKLGNNIFDLIELCGENKEVAVIANALDNMPNNYRTERVRLEIQNLKSIGFNPVELDLRMYFKDKELLRKILEKKSMVWVRGGSAFILNRAMIESGFHDIWVQMIKNSQLVYGGYSAALIVATTSLSGTEVVDDPTIIPKGYSDNINPIKGLGLIDFYLIPHINSKESWAKNIPFCVENLRKQKKKVLTLSDWETFIVNN